jgi:hypothetical protein
MWYSNLEKKHLLFDISSTDIDTLVPLLYQCVETHSIEFSWLLSQPIPPSVSISSSLREFFETILNHYPANTSTLNRILCDCTLYWDLLPIKSHNRTLLLGITLLKHGLHFNYSNQHLNVRMRLCYLNCHEVGLCCYLVIHIENLLHPFQLFYFHLCPIYWLSLVATFDELLG